MTDQTSHKTPAASQMWTGMADVLEEAVAMSSSMGLPARWSVHARPEQTPPNNKDWSFWVIMGGRGGGKTWSGAGYTVDQVKKGNIRRIALVPRTSADARDVMIEGVSGLIAMSRAEGMSAVYEPSKRRVTWENGAIATAYSSEQPQLLEGPAHDFAWCDEARNWKDGGKVWDTMVLGLRMGQWPRAIVTTTPLNLGWLKKLIASERTHLTTVSTLDNLDNLSPIMKETILDRYKGTRLEIQEIMGRILEDIEGALWDREVIERQRSWDFPVTTVNGVEVPDIRRAIVSIDPAVTNTQYSDETGICGAVRGGDGKIYVVHDWSIRASPNAWAKRAVNLYDLIEGDRIIGEVNNGGDLVKELIRVVRPGAPFKAIRASRGKHVRAEPVAAMFEKDEVRLLGQFEELEDQMANMTVDGYVGDGSPDRVDAMVYAIMELSRRGKGIQFGSVDIN